MNAIASSSRVQLRLSATAFAYARCLATSTPVFARQSKQDDTPRTGVDLVAPPDPISNIRPIIYASRPSWRSSTNSPYSAEEFPSDADAKLESRELEWRLRRERVDMMNHTFWAENNMEFEAQLQRRLSQLPPASNPPSAIDIKRRDDCLTQFYADWQITNQDRQTKWVMAWWREIWVGLRTQASLYLHRALRLR